MNNEEKIAEALLRLTVATQTASNLNDQLDKANADICKADEALVRVCHAVFGDSDKEIIYDGCRWEYAAKAKAVTCQPWEGLIIGNGKTPRAN